MSGFWKNRKRPPWYTYPPILVGVLTARNLFDWLAALDLSPANHAFGFLVGLFAIPYSAFHAGKWLSHRFPALETDREDIDIFGRTDREYTDILRRTDRMPRTVWRLQAVAAMAAAMVGSELLRSHVFPDIHGLLLFLACISLAVGAVFLFNSRRYGALSPQPFKRR